MNLQSSRCNGHIKLTGITGLEARTPNQRAFSGVPEAVKPRDIAISAASETGVKLTPNVGSNAFNSQIQSVKTI